jgi:hypothetical protein
MLLSVANFDEALKVPQVGAAVLRCGYSVLRSAVQCSAVLCSAVQCCAVLCCAVQCSAVQCSAVHTACAPHSLPS